MANLVLVTGSADLSSTASYDTAALPADTDSVYYRNSSTNITAGTNQSAIEPALVEVERSFTGRFPATGEFQMGPAILNVGRLNGVATQSQTGSSRIVWDNGPDPCALTVFYTNATPADLGYESFRWRGTDSGNTLTVFDGIVGIATNDPDDTATVASFFIYGGTVNFGGGVTLTTGVVDGGSAVSIRSAMTTFTQNLGTVLFLGSGAITTNHIRGGVQEHKSTGTITTCNLLEGATLRKWSGAATVTTMNWAGTIDLSQATGTITFTNTNRLSKNAKLIDPFKRAVFTNPIQNAADVYDADGIIRGGGGTIQLA